MLFMVSRFVLTSILLCLTLIVSNVARHNVVVSLKFPYINAPRRGVLIISRPKVLGGKLEIALDFGADSVRLVPVTRKEADRFQFGVRYGSWHRRAILRAPTSAIYETWWAALETTLTMLTYVALPLAAAPTPRVNLVVNLKVKPTAVRPDGAAFSSSHEVFNGEAYAMLDDVPLLEANGPMSPGEIDVLASWRTWGSLEYFATPLDFDDPLSMLETAGIDNDTNENNTSCAEIPRYSDISEFWTRASDVETHQAPTCTVESCHTRPAVPLQRITLKSQNDEDEKWLDEIAHFAFRQKVGAAFMPEQRPKRQMTGQLRLHPGSVLFQRETSFHHIQLSS